MTDRHIRTEDLTLLEQAALLSGADVWQTRALPRVGVPAVWMSDGPHGLRKQERDADHLGLGESEPAVCFPTAATVANTWDEDLAEEIGRALGREAACKGVHMLLGPGLNIKRSPLGGRNFEYFSEDPELSGRLAAAYVRGIQSEGVAATPKHFAVNSQELRRLVSDSVVDERTLRELYLTGFEIVVREAAPWAIMSSYNLVNGTYTHENAHLLTDILRQEWGFDGVVVSDWGGSNDPVAAVAAGGTLEMPSPGFSSARLIVSAVQNGNLAAVDLHDRVDEVLTLTRRVNRHPHTAPVDASDIAHHALARRAAAEGTVLLRNENSILPIASGTRVALVGAFAVAPRYQGAGSSVVNPTRLTNLRDAIEQTTLTLSGYAPGYRLDGSADDALLQEAAHTALDADVAVVAVGIPDADETEGRDRPHLRLPQPQVEALRAVAATGTPVVVVLAGGGPVEVPWLNETTALLHCYLGGQAGAEAVWDVLTGHVNPGGRLAETMPMHVEDAPASAEFPSDRRTAEYREALYVGYRYHTSTGIAPAFPFGFGLSYTRFVYSDLHVTNTEARFTVTNVGERAGSDVAQVYVRRLSPSGVPRPDRELKGFTKVRLKSGERSTVVVPLGERTFRFFDVRTSTWQVEEGDYEILVGPHSADLPLAATLHVTGTVPAGEVDQALAAYAEGDVHRVPDAAFAALLGRELPTQGWAAPPFDRDTPIDQLRRSPSRLVRFAFRFLERAKRRADAQPYPDLSMAFIFHGPLRTLDKMTDGTFTPEFTEAMILIADGNVARGLWQAARAYLAGRRAELRTRQELASGSP
ncbi:glycoside hydrolase family 3 C-terminal domain-containing protein [Microbacterium sp. ZW T5_45]|uniref:glycoside hydrolase family 3 C-terminal domain-containing protein n=1 Tax=Microbacterium sp. ZW T5_45 TaxID=3378080 RepID=UPI0038547F9E